MRLIDADRLLEERRMHTYYHLPNGDTAVPIVDIQHAPTIEPEHKMGHWVWDVNGMDWNLGAWCCSECGIKAETWWANDKKYNPLKCSGGNFCGICGADMRGEQDG